jgi:hypothetical protein
MLESWRMMLPPAYILDLFLLARDGSTCSFLRHLFHSSQAHTEHLFDIISMLPTLTDCPFAAGLPSKVQLVFGNAKEIHALRAFLHV